MNLRPLSSPKLLIGNRLYRKASAVMADDGTGKSELTKNGCSLPSEFDLNLRKEIEDVKRKQETKYKRRKANAKQGKSTSELRDDSGFKLRVVERSKLDRRQADPDYEIQIEGPLRKIKPYYFLYKTFCKERWRDKKLIDIFSSEFRDRSREYYEKTIASGSVKLDDHPADLESTLRNGMMISHNVHRHEPPVTSKPIKTVFENDDILVVDKPSGIPVHPTGRYRFNTMTKSLEKQLGYPVHPCNRLDRLTSGLMFLAKTPKGADEIGDQMKAREVSKEYIARVVGEFPIGEVVVDKPLRSIEPKLSLSGVCTMEDKDSKFAKTVFNRISFDGQTSIVKCKPLTGRSHQIRVHLQYLGHPIANDPIYSNPNVWGPNLGKDLDEIDIEDIKEKLDAVGKTQPAESWFYPNYDGEILTGKKCPDCEAELYSDPGPNDLNLWLHAYRYASTEINESTGKLKWSYKTSFPDWAIEPHREYMELAIKEAAKCEPTTTAFSVGAALVNGTKVLSTGYSRELPGNTHAEQCALEKYFARVGKREVPMGSVIYTTMEPCSFRLSENEPCVERIIKQNGNIAAVFVGVMEPDTFVKNNTSLRLLEENLIDYVLIPGYEEECMNLAAKGHDNVFAN